MKKDLGLLVGDSRAESFQVVLSQVKKDLGLLVGDSRAESFQVVLSPVWKDLGLLVGRTSDGVISSRIESGVEGLGPAGGPNLGRSHFKSY